jgi:hypothetical protein
MKALISPLESCQTGYRVAWTNPVEIEHAYPYFWVDCSNNVVQDLYWYDPTDQQIKLVPEPVISAEENKAIAKQLLSDTDWVNEPDVINPDINPHLLNQSEFLAYRSQVRLIAINPTEGEIDWPLKPEEQWSSV